MAFCRYCGKKLEEGEVCHCQDNVAPVVNQQAEVSQNQQETVGAEVTADTQQAQAQPNQQFTAQSNQQAQAQPNQQFTAQPNQQAQAQPNQQFTAQSIQDSQAVKVAGAYLRQLGDALLGIVKKPAEFGKSFVAAGDEKLAIGILLLQAVFSGIFVMLFCNKINSVVKSAGSFMGSVDSKYLASLPKAFVLTVIGSLILSFVVAGLLFVGVTVLKGNTTFWKMLCVSSVRSVGKSLFILIAIVISFLNLTWGIGIFILSALIGWVFMIPVIQGGAEFSENKQVYMVGAVIILSLVVFYFLAKFGIPMYVPTELKDAFQDVIDKFSSLSSFSGLY